MDMSESVSVRSTRQRKASTVSDTATEAKKAKVGQSGGPTRLKHRCFTCAKNKWVVDYGADSAEDLSRTSVCLFCELKTSNLSLQRELQEVRKDCDRRLKEQRTQFEAELRDLREEFLAVGRGLATTSTPGRPSYASIAKTPPRLVEVESRMRALAERFEELQREVATKDTAPERMSLGSPSEPQVVDLSGESLGAVERYIDRMAESVRALRPSETPRRGDSSHRPTVAPRQLLRPPPPSSGRPTEGEDGTSNQRRTRRRRGRRKARAAAPVQRPEPPQLAERRGSGRRHAGRGPGTTSRDGGLRPLEEPLNLLIGDSMVSRDVTRVFSARRKANRVMSFPGARVTRITTEIGKLSLNKDSTIVVSVGGNDLFLSRHRCGPSEVLLRDFEDLVRAAKKKTSRVIVVGLIPRRFHQDEHYSKAVGVNERLAMLCRHYSLRFVDPWANFFGRSGHFCKDGVHFSRSGAQEFSALLNAKLFRPVKKPAVEVGRPRGVRRAEGPRPAARRVLGGASSGGRSSSCPAVLSSTGCREVVAAASAQEARNAPSAPAAVPGSTTTGGSSRDPSAEAPSKRVRSPTPAESVSPTQAVDPKRPRRESDGEASEEGDPAPPPGNEQAAGETSSP